jgi:hypothetical protein
MHVPLPYVGEVVVAAMVNQMRLAFLDLCGLTDQCDLAFVTSPATPIAYTDVTLLPYAGKIFDGASRIDIVVLLSENLGVPLEIKLGTTRLSKTRIDEEWLNGCGLSHRDSRIKGNIMSILERRFPDSVPADSLMANVCGRPVTLTDDWFIVARAKVVDAWIGPRRPIFSPKAKLCRFEDIVRSFGGRAPFNTLMKKLLDFDYYSEWVEDGT